MSEQDERALIELSRAKRRVLMKLRNLDEFEIADFEQQELRAMIAEVRAGEHRLMGR